MSRQCLGGVGCNTRCAAQEEAAFHACTHLPGLTLQAGPKEVSPGGVLAAMEWLASCLIQDAMHKVVEDPHTSDPVVVFLTRQTLFLPLATEHKRRMNDKASLARGMELGDMGWG